MKNQGLKALAILLIPSLLYVFFALFQVKGNKMPYFGPRLGVKPNPETKNDTLYFITPALDELLTNDSIPGHFLLNRAYVVLLLDLNHKNYAQAVNGIAQYYTLNNKKIENIPLVFAVKADSTNPQQAINMADTIGLKQAEIYTQVVSPARYDSLMGLYFPPSEPRFTGYKTKEEAVFIDHKGRIRGYYDCRYVTGAKQINEDAAYLKMMEESDELAKRKIEKR